VIDTITKQHLQYGELQKELLVKSKKIEAKDFLTRIPDPAIEYIFPNNQAPWLMEFMSRLPGARVRIIEPPKIK
jgi:hypothetical protein